MVFWEAGKLASILRHRGDNINTGYLNPLQNRPRNENVLNGTEWQACQCCLPRIPLCRIVHGLYFAPTTFNQSGVNVVVQFYPWFNFYFPLFLCMVMYDNELKTKENKN